MASVIPWPTCAPAAAVVPAATVLASFSPAAATVHEIGVEVAAEDSAVCFGGLTLAATGMRYRPEVVGESETHPGYVRRRRSVSGTSERKPVIGRVAPLEEALRNFQSRGNRYIICPKEGMVFDSYDEAYEFYNLHSWEKGFGIRCNSSEKNNAQYEFMKEIVCMCQGRMCGCKSRMVLRRTDDHGWYIRHFVDDHNHEMSETCGEKQHWPSHKHLDIYTRDIIKHLRKNNISLGKVYSIMSEMFGSVQSSPM